MPPPRRCASACTAPRPVRGRRRSTLRTSASTLASSVDALRVAAAKFPGESLILVRAGTALPPFWRERLTRALALADVPSPRRSTISIRCVRRCRRMQRAMPQPSDVDAACYRHGDRTPLQWPTISPLLSAWNGAALKAIDLASLSGDALPPTLSPWRAMLVGDLYVADPAKPLRGPRAPKPGEDDVPPSPLGELRERVAASLRTQRAAAYPGPRRQARRAARAARLGRRRGALRARSRRGRQRSAIIWCSSRAAISRGAGSANRSNCSTATLRQPPLRSAPLPIRSPARARRIATYKEFLDGILRDFCVDAVVVSSLIGHSLDVLRTGLPTIHFIHDYYPLWPMLHRDFGDAALPFDDALLTQDLQAPTAGSEFAERDAAHWRALREQTADALSAARATLIAPSRRRARPVPAPAAALAELPQHVIAHGTALPQTDVALPLAAPPRREKLRLLVLGRVRRGKGAELLRDCCRACASTPRFSCSARVRKARRCSASATCTSCSTTSATNCRNCSRASRPTRR